MVIIPGSTNVSVYFYIVGNNAHATPGEPVTGLVFGDIETGGQASYMRQGAARVDAGTVITMTVAGAHSDGGFVQVDATNMPGIYRFDAPDAAFATGVSQVYLQLLIATAKNAIAAPLVIDLVADPLHTQLTETYAADGTVPTLEEAILLVQQMLTDFSVAGTTWTVKKIDGTTTAATFTLSPDGQNPTAMTRAT